VLARVRTAIRAADAAKRKENAAVTTSDYSAEYDARPRDADTRVARRTDRWSKIAIWVAIVAGLLVFLAAFVSAQMSGDIGANVPGAPGATTQTEDGQPASVDTGPAGAAGQAVDNATTRGDGPTDIPRDTTVPDAFGATTGSPTSPGAPTGATQADPFREGASGYSGTTRGAYGPSETAPGQGPAVTGTGDTVGNPAAGAGNMAGGAVTGGR
jgi:hypothetical protein